MYFFPFISFHQNWKFQLIIFNRMDSIRMYPIVSARTHFLLQILVTIKKYKERFILDKNVLFISALKILLNDFWDKIFLTFFIWNCIFLHLFNYFLKLKELSLRQKFKFSYPFIFKTWQYKHFGLQA